MRKWTPVTCLGLFVVSLASPLASASHNQLKALEAQFKSELRQLNQTYRSQTTAMRFEFKQVESAIQQELRAAKNLCPSDSRARAGTSSLCPAGLTAKLPGRPQ